MKHPNQKGLDCLMELAIVLAVLLVGVLMFLEGCFSVSQ